LKVRGVISTFKFGWGEELIGVENQYVKQLGMLVIKDGIPIWFEDLNGRKGFGVLTFMH